MRTKIDAEGRVVVPLDLRRRLGLERGGEVDVDLDGTGLRIEPVSDSVVVEEDGFLVIPAIGEPISNESVVDLIDAVRHRS